MTGDACEGNLAGSEAPTKNMASVARGLSGMLFLLFGCSLGFPVEKQAFQDAPAISGGNVSTSTTAFFRITVVDEASSRGIPCVRVSTTNAAEFWTDNAGVVAFFEPDLMNRDVYFDAETHGYSRRKNAYGAAGVTVRTTPGGRITIPMHRDSIAQRLYRFTGAGQFRESQLLGDPIPGVAEPDFPPVMGQDGGDAVAWGGKIYWFWGDTLIPRFPLGVFKSVAAISEFPEHGGLSPDGGINLRYLRTSNGDLRPMVNLPGAVYWYSVPRTATDSSGKEHLLTDYCQVEGYLNATERGMLEYDETSGFLERRCVFPKDSAVPFNRNEGTPFRFRKRDREYFLYPSPYPAVRCPADFESQTDFSVREAFTCLRDGSRFDGSAEQLDRDSKGSLVWKWRRNTSPIAEAEMNKLTESGAMRPEERWYAVTDVDSGKPVKSHNGSINYNPWRKRWVCLRLESAGASPVGEVWYLEGDTPLGPWIYARKIATHAWRGHAYAFYGVGQLPMFDREGGRVIYFKGSFSAEFGDGNPIPRHNYNNFMYGLNLDDPRLALPVPIYCEETTASRRFGPKDAVNPSGEHTRIAWFAPDRPFPGSVPVMQATDGAGGSDRLVVGTAGVSVEAKAAFHAVAADAAITTGSGAELTVPLYEIAETSSGRTSYATTAAISNGNSETSRIVCRVWPNPILFNPHRVESAR